MSTGSAFDGHKAFIPYLTAGDPDLETTEQLLLELERAGADLVEVGVPFSDPVADGPVIQRASERALRHGYRMDDYLEVIGRIRQRSRVPLLLFSYYNPLLQYGLEKLADRARRVGLDAVLTTDLTPEEAGPFCRAFRQAGIDTVFLVAPTSTPERIRRIAAVSSGFIYLVSRTGVTGARERLSDEIQSKVQEVRSCTRLPVAVGFGISRPEHVRQVWELADGAVVGSALVAHIEQHRGERDLVAQGGEFARWLKGI
ncbi:MAG: tryptophan synthase subunit alpha [Acidobacteria bacterium]|nr:tryptophan synthase subunit alpha [Acidobacteriota bacterium]